MFFVIVVREEISSRSTGIGDVSKIHSANLGRVVVVMVVVYSHKELRTSE
jgi:hypothetical protein